MQHIAAGDLEVAYLDHGPADGPPVLLLHGFPYDVHSYDVVAKRLVAAGRRCIVPYLRGYGPTRFRSGSTLRSGQQAAFAADLLALMDALAIPSATLAGYDWGGRAACVVAALAPARADGLVSCGNGYNIQDLATATQPAAPDAEIRHWYWFYLSTERGRNALVEDRGRLCRALWKGFSPTWAFDESDFVKTAASFDNPDFIDVVLHSYRVRIGAAEGDPKLAAVERQLSAKPVITCPTIILSGADDGVDPPAPQAAITGRFSQLRDVRLVPGAGHNVPQEAPAVFADAVLALGTPSR